MFRKGVGVLGLIFFLAGCAATMGVGGLEAKHGKSSPVIAQSFAARELRLGDTWKVYLKAFDPDGDMNYVVATIDQPGRGAGGYPVSYLRIKNGGKELSGYVYLNTNSTVQRGLEYTNITLSVSIRDKAGHDSNTVAFPLHFHRLARQEAPPAGVFAEQALGPIMIELRPLGDGGGGEGAK